MMLAPWGRCPPTLCPGGDGAGRAGCPARVGGCGQGCRQLLLPSFCLNNLPACAAADGWGGCCGLGGSGGAGGSVGACLVLAGTKGVASASGNGAATLSWCHPQQDVGVRGGMHWGCGGLGTWVSPCVGG